MVGQSYATVRTRLLVAQVPLRPRGGDTRRLQQDDSRPLTGEAGARRYREAVARGDMPAPGTPSRAAAGASPRPSAGSRAGRRPRPPRIRPVDAGPRQARSGAPGALGAVDDELVALIAVQASALLAERCLQAAVAQLSDDEVWDIAQAIRVAFDGGQPLVAPTGSTRGVRRNPQTGQPERF
jgi:hypothetical protein